MERTDLDAEMLAADQELSALLEKHINAPVKKSIEQASGSLSLMLKGDFETNVYSLRSELKKLNEAFEDLTDDLGNVRNVAKRTESLVLQAEGAQDARHEKLSTQVLDNERRLNDGLAGIEERLSKLSNAQLHHLNSAIKALAAEVQGQRAAYREEQQKVMDKLEALALQAAALEAQVSPSQRLSKRRFAWLTAGLLVNFGALVALLVKGFI
jgi:hypothetical protein